MPADFQLADTSVGSIFYPDRRHFGHFAHPVSKKQFLSQAKRPLSGNSQGTAFWPYSAYAISNRWEPPIVERWCGVGAIRPDLLGRSDPPKNWSKLC